MIPDSYPPALAAVCKRVRLAQGLTQEGLAERVGVHPDTIRRHERGARVTLLMAAKVAAGLRMRLSAIIEQSERESEDTNTLGPEQAAAMVELRRLDEARLKFAVLVLRSLADLP